MPEKTEQEIKEILDNFAKYAFDEGMKCVKDNIDPQTGLWKLAKKFVDMTEARNIAVTAILAIIEKEKGKIVVDEEKLKNFIGSLMVKESLSFQITGGHPEDMLNYFAHSLSARINEWAKIE